MLKFNWKEKISWDQYYNHVTIKLYNPSISNKKKNA